MGAENVLSSEDPQEREERKQHVSEMYLEARRMIREDSGVNEIDKLFKEINKPELTSPVIERIRYLKKHGLENSVSESDEGV